MTIAFANNWKAELTAPLLTDHGRPQIASEALDRLPLKSDPEIYQLTLGNPEDPAEFEIIRAVRNDEGLWIFDRGREGTTPREWPAGSILFCSITAETMRALARFLDAPLASIPEVITRAADETLPAISIFQGFFQATLVSGVYRVEALLLYSTTASRAAFEFKVDPPEAQHSLAISAPETKTASKAGHIARAVDQFEVGVYEDSTIMLARVDGIIVATDYAVLDIGFKALDSGGTITLHAGTTLITTPLSRL